MQTALERLRAEERAREYWKKVDILEKIDADGGALNGREAIDAAYEMWENFRAWRNLRYTAGHEMVPWLHDKKIGSKFWGEKFMATPPFKDHRRDFVDRDTTQRIVTIQPYWPTVVNDLRMWETLPQEFKDLDQQWNEEVWDGKFKRRPDVPVVRETFEAIMSAAQRVSNEFAREHGLKVKVSFDGWYAPERVILIEYTAKGAA